MFARLTSRITQGHITRLAVVPERTAAEPVRHVYRGLAREFGVLAPPVTLHAGSPPVLAACWVMLRETLLVHRDVGRDIKEVVAAAVSLANRCPYCVDVHGSALRGLLRGPDARAIADDRLDLVADARLRGIAEWFRHGDASTPPPGVPAAQLPELIGVAVLFHYLNRVVNVFLVPSPLPPGLPSAATPLVRRVAALVMGRFARRGGAPGVDLDLLPPAPLPPDLAWATGNDGVAAAFARAGAAIDEAAERSVPPAVRRLLTELLAGPAGPAAITDRAGLEAALAVVARRDRPATRLALTTAFLSWRVTDAVVTDCRLEDRALLELVSWAALTAARAAGARRAADWAAGDPPGAGS